MILWVSEWRGSKRTSAAKKANEWAVQANEPMDERVAQYFRLYSWLFWSIVRFMNDDDDDELIWMVIQSGNGEENEKK